MKTTNDLKRRSGAEMRAQRDQRQAMPGPMLEAARRAQVIRDGLNSFADAIEKMADAYNRDDWKTLGYKNWQEYCEGEFSPASVRLTVEQRKQAAASLTSAGLTKRAAAAALGVSHTTVQKDASGNKLPLPTGEDQVKADVDVADDVARATAAFDEKYSQDPSGGVEGTPPEVEDSPDASTGLEPAQQGLRPGTDSSTAGNTDPGALVAEQSGTQPPVEGEAPAPAGLGAGVGPSAEAGVSEAGEAVEGGASPPPVAPSFTDPASEWMDGWRGLIRSVIPVAEYLTEAELAEVRDDLSTLAKVLFGEST